jgi:hypothetical protein
LGAVLLAVAFFAETEPATFLSLSKVTAETPHASRRIDGLPQVD